MKFHKLIIISFALASGLVVNAKTRQCYVQSQGSDEVYKDPIGTIQIDEQDFTHHIVHREGDQLYTVQFHEDGKVTAAIFNTKDKKSLILVTANAKEGLTLINEPLKRLLGCQAAGE